MEESIKPPALGGLDGFEVWDRTVHAPTDKAVKDAFVSLRTGGMVGINLRCYAMWGKPDYCQVMFDPERRRLAFRPVPKDTPNSYWLGDAQKQVPLRNLFSYYGVEIVETRRYYDPKVVHGVLVVDL